MLNKVTLIGHLGADPEVRYMPNGSAIATIRLATTRRWKDKQTGERKDATEWHRVTFFAPLAEIVRDYLKKGSLAYVEGRLQTRKWQDKDGQERYTTDIMAEAMQILSSRSGGGNPAFNDNTDAYSAPSIDPGFSAAPAPAYTAPSAPRPAPMPPPMAPPAMPATPNYDDFDDDIPF